MVNILTHKIVLATTALLWLAFACVPASAAENNVLSAIAGNVVFVAGEATLAGQPASERPVHEGDEIVTGADGHVYIRTVDGGYFILRPGSRARIVIWRINAQDPAGARFKIELTQGVARNITGHAVKAARQNFRFNTPVAAIGVRGTDFTVFTDASTTRVAVHSGSIVASPFGLACTLEGGGPCEGSTSLALLAEQTGLLLQIERGQAQPRLLHINGNAPDHLAPPRREEPGRQTANTTSTNRSEPERESQRAANVLAEVTSTAAAVAAVPVVPPRQVHWGRWSPLAGQPAGIDITALLADGGNIVALNPWFAVLRGPGPDWQKPAAGAMSFALKGSEAMIINEPTGAITPAKIENARLQVDFGRASFTTGFDLVGSQHHAFQAQGQIASDGRLYGNSQFASPTNMAVEGQLGAANGGSAAYLFQGRIDNNLLATGATAWQRQ